MASIFAFAKCSNCDVKLFQDEDPRTPCFAWLGQCSHRLCENCASGAAVCPVCGQCSSFGRRYFSDANHVVELIASVLCDLTKVQITPRPTFTTSLPPPTDDLFTFSSSNSSVYSIPSNQYVNSSIQPQKPIQQPSNTPRHQPRAYIPKPSPIESRPLLESETLANTSHSAEEQERAREQKILDLERFKPPQWSTAQPSPKKTAPPPPPPKRARAKNTSSNTSTKNEQPPRQEPQSLQQQSLPTPVANGRFELQPTPSAAPYSPIVAERASAFLRSAFPSSATSGTVPAQNIVSPTPKRTSKVKEHFAVQRQPSLMESSQQAPTISTASRAQIHSMTYAESRDLYQRLAAQFQ